MYDPEPAPRQHGCFFYGCIIAVVLVVLVVAIALMGGYYVYHRLTQAVLPYTSEAPMELPKVELTEAQSEAIRQRFKEFKQALDTGKPVEPLILTADDINCLITDDPNFKGHVFVTIEDDKLKGQVSIPLDAFLLVPAFRGRYLNGSAELKVALVNGILVVTADSIEVKGKPLPPKTMAAMRGQNLARNAANNPQNAKVLGKLDSIQIKDGKVIVTARSKHESESEAPEKGEEKGSAEGPEAPKAERDGKTESAPALPPAEGKAEGAVQPKAAA